MKLPSVSLEAREHWASPAARHLTLLATTLVMLGLHSSSSEAASLRWVDVDPDKNPKIAQLIQGQCLPREHHLAYPIPNSAHVVFVYWNGPRPSCEGTASRSDTSAETLLLLSKEPVSLLADHFRGELIGRGFTELVLPRDSVTDPCCSGTMFKDGQDGTVLQMTVFIQSAIDMFCWNKHRYSAPMVTVSKASDLYRFSGYQTMIELIYPDLSIPKGSRAAKSAQNDDLCAG